MQPTAQEQFFSHYRDLMFTKNGKSTTKDIPSALRRFIQNYKHSENNSKKIFSILSCIDKLEAKYEDFQVNQKIVTSLWTLYLENELCQEDNHNRIARAGRLFNKFSLTIQFGELKKSMWLGLIDRMLENYQSQLLPGFLKLLSYCPFIVTNLNSKYKDKIKQDITENPQLLSEHDELKVYSLALNIIDNYANTQCIAQNAQYLLNSTEHSKIKLLLISNLLPYRELGTLSKNNPALFYRFLPALEDELFDDSPELCAKYLYDLVLHLPKYHHISLQTWDILNNIFRRLIVNGASLQSLDKIYFQLIGHISHDESCAKFCKETADLIAERLVDENFIDTIDLLIPFSKLGITDRQSPVFYKQFLFCLQNKIDQLNPSKIEKLIIFLGLTGVDIASINQQAYLSLKKQLVYFKKNYNKNEIANILLSLARLEINDKSLFAELFKQFFTMPENKQDKVEHIYPKIYIAYIYILHFKEYWNIKFPKRFLLQMGQLLFDESNKKSLKASKFQQSVKLVLEEAGCDFEEEVMQDGFYMDFVVYQSSRRDCGGIVVEAEGEYIHYSPFNQLFHKDQFRYKLLRAAGYHHIVHVREGIWNTLAVNERVNYLKDLLFPPCPKQKKENLNKPDKKLVKKPVKKPEIIKPAKKAKIKFNLVNFKQQLANRHNIKLYELQQADNIIDTVYDLIKNKLSTEQDLILFSQTVTDKFINATYQKTYQFLKPSSLYSALYNGRCYGLYLQDRDGDVAFTEDGLIEDLAAALDMRVEDIKKRPLMMEA